MRCTHGVRVVVAHVVVSDVVERVRVVVDRRAVGQRMVHDVVLVSQVTGGRGVPRVHRHRARQRYAAAAPGERRLAAAADALRRGRPPLVVQRGGDGHRVRAAARAAVVDLVPVVAQRRPRARLHLDVRHVRRRVRLLGRGALLVVRAVRLRSEIGCDKTKKIIIISVVVD